MHVCTPCAAGATIAAWSTRPVSLCRSAPDLSLYLPRRPGQFSALPSQLVHARPIFPHRSAPDLSLYLSLAVLTGWQHAYLANASLAATLLLPSDTAVRAFLQQQASIGFLEQLSAVWGRCVCAPCSNRACERCQDRPPRQPCLLHFPHILPRSPCRSWHPMRPCAEADPRKRVCTVRPAGVAPGLPHPAPAAHVSMPP